MITIQVLGLDQFVVGRYSREHTPNLAQLFETEEDEIVFFVFYAMVFHKGVEQTSWNTLVIIRLSEKYHPLEAAVADYLDKTLRLFTINLHVEFAYVEEEHCHLYVNPQYPRYITTAESTEDEYTFEFGDMPDQLEGDISIEEDEHEHHHHHHHHDDEEEEKDEVYLGNAFEGFEEKYEDALKKKGN